MEPKNTIIINGVDVSQCEDYVRIGNSGHWCYNYDKPCTDYHNCCFKQLARKEQECEDLKRKEKYLYNFLTNRYNYGSFKEVLGAYLLKKIFNEELRDFFNPKTYEKVDIIIEKTNEINQLKSENEAYKQMLDNPEVRVALTDIRTGERDLWQKYKPRMERAEQKLEQIEAYCKEQNLKADYTACEILQIIDEVENE